MKSAKALRDKQETDLAADGSLQRLLQQEAHGLHHALGNLQRHVADKAVAYQHIGLAVVEIAAFDIAHEIQRQLSESACRLRG